MNNRNNRMTGAIVASISLLAIIVFALPWVDEYLRLRKDAAQLTELETRSNELQQRNQQLNRIDARLTSDLNDLQARSIDPTTIEGVRETIVQIVRAAGGRIRRLEIPNAERRRWSAEGDHVRNGTMPIYGDESDFELHNTMVELQVDGSLQSIQQILQGITNQGWLMATKELGITPTKIRQSPVRLEMQLVLYGLTPAEQDRDEEFANHLAGSVIR